MRRRALQLALVTVCSLVAQFSMSSTPRHIEPVVSMGVEHDWSGLAPAKQAQDAFYAAVSKPAPTEGNLRAQAEQEATITGDAVTQVICSVFVENCAVAVRVARCESGLNPEARNQSGAAGLFQLLGHADLFAAHGWEQSVDWDDAYRNSVVAHDLWESVGWTPWVCAA